MWCRRRMFTKQVSEARAMVLAAPQTGTPRMGLSCSHTLGRAARGRAIARPPACTIFGKASLALVTERVDPSNAKWRPES
jgi:hypothetical protein